MMKSAASIFVGATIFVLIRSWAIESIGELRFMKREAERREKVIKESLKQKKAEYQTQIYLTEYVDTMKAERERIQRLEEMIKNHWGWKILNPKKEYVSKFDFL